MATVKIPAQKVILVGEYGVGKSSLFRRFANDTFVRASDRQSTLGLDNFGKVYQMKDTDRALKLQLWDTGGMERVASITSSYYKYSEAAILVFALDRPDSFHVLSQHLLDIVTYAENAKIFLCGNKFDLKSRIQVTDGEMEAFSEQCHNLMSGLYKTSCKTGEGVEEMFRDIANQLSETNRFVLNTFKNLLTLVDPDLMLPPGHPRPEIGTSAHRSKIELQSLEEARSFRIDQAQEADENGPNDCSC